MKVVVAIDSFKGSLSSMEAGMAVKKGILSAKNANIVVKPLADGGEGTIDALMEGMGGEIKYLDVTGPLSIPVKAKYGILSDRKMAVIEMAEAAGITLVTPEEKSPLKSTTYGVGELIKDAISNGCRNFIIGIGGSATTDGGAGMLTALGYEFLNADGQPVKPGLQGLAEIETIATGQSLPELRECRFTVACDVNNPLCGSNGAVYVYGPQKGVKDSDKKSFDEMMTHYAKKTIETMKCDFTLAEGAGAAGGLGYAFMSYLNAELKSGVSIVLDAIGLENEIKDADYVVTGEGRLDIQSSMGKVPVGVAKLAKKYNKKVIAFAGSVTKDAGLCNQCGIDAFFPIVRGVTTLEEAMEPENAKENMSLAAEQVFRLL